MGHYDWAYADFSIEETEKESSRTESLINKLQDKKSQILIDLPKVTEEYTSTILKEEIDDLVRKIETYSKEKKGWEKVKERITSGKNTSWEQAHNIAKNKW